ncbi:YtxH domain-containing protein [Streptococcus castoreus]|uniref:YtxH domain-containing protein n=1 Tax=Streptococcus castoreus TaxID=254786 RepID=UPI000404F3C9|nr:YtxH domain-containing protein [Streptococcus castoreus]
MSKCFKTLMIGAVSGAAVGYFLSTEKGKAFKARVEKACQAYKENPNEYHQLVKEKGSEYLSLACDTFNDLREKVESGDLTGDQLLDLFKDKATDFMQKTKTPVVDVEINDHFSVDLSENDIIIDYEDIEAKVSTNQGAKDN